MSAATFAGLVLASTSEEKKAAELAHTQAVAAAPSDAENIAAFLSQCEIGPKNLSTAGIQLPTQDHRNPKVGDQYLWKDAVIAITKVNPSADKDNNDYIHFDNKMQTSLIHLGFMSPYEAQAISHPNEGSFADHVIAVAQKHGFNVSLGEIGEVMASHDNPSPKSAFEGRVLAVDEFDGVGLVFQSMGRGEARVFLASTLSRVPEVGEMMKVTFREGRGQMEDKGWEQGKGNER